MRLTNDVTVAAAAGEISDSVMRPRVVCAHTDTGRERKEELERERDLKRTANESQIITERKGKQKKNQGYMMSVGRIGLKGLGEV